MSDLSDLYQEVILDHNKRPRNFRAIESPTHRAEGYNPLCGDRLNLFSTRAAYLANDDAEYARAHPGALEKGYIGRIEGGVFQPSTY